MSGKYIYALAVRAFLLPRSFSNAANSLSALKTILEWAAYLCALLANDSHADSGALQADRGVRALASLAGGDGSLLRAVPDARDEALGEELRAPAQRRRTRRAAGVAVLHLGGSADLQPLRRLL